MANNNTRLGDAVFNDAFGYLDTISWLIRKAHEMSVDDDDVVDWFMILEQLHLELDGQLLGEDVDKDTPEQEALEKLRKGVSESLRDTAKMSNKSLFDLRDIVRPYHQKLNRVAHKYQLRMKNDKDGFGGLNE